MHYRFLGRELEFVGVIMSEDEKVKLPETIFKYESFSTQSLLNLKKQCIYFGSPRNFNYPYDCALTASIDEPSINDLDRVREYFLGNKELPEEAKNVILGLSKEEFKKQVLDGATFGLTEFNRKFLIEKGVSCFSEKNDNLLMWAHYGGSYKGFCLEFRTNFESLNKIRPVKYVESTPKITVDLLIADQQDDQILDLYCTKSNSWSYEKEWRGIHNKVGTEYIYETDALKAVYFGPDIAQAALEIICLILGGQNPKVEFWKGVRSKTQFKVDFTKVEYLPYDEAKRRGLRK